MSSEDNMTEREQFLFRPDDPPMGGESSNSPETEKISQSNELFNNLQNDITSESDPDKKEKLKELRSEYLQTEDAKKALKDVIQIADDIDSKSTPEEVLDTVRSAIAMTEGKGETLTTALRKEAIIQAGQSKAIKMKMEEEGASYSEIVRKLGYESYEDSRFYDDGILDQAVVNNSMTEQRTVYEADTSSEMTDDDRNELEKIEWQLKNEKVKGVRTHLENQKKDLLSKYSKPEANIPEETEEKGESEYNRATAISFIMSNDASANRRNHEEKRKELKGLSDEELKKREKEIEDKLKSTPSGSGGTPTPPPTPPTNTGGPEDGNNGRRPGESLTDYIDRIAGSKDKPTRVDLNTANERVFDNTIIQDVLPFADIEAEEVDLDNIEKYPAYRQREAVRKILNTIENTENATYDDVLKEEQKQLAAIEKRLHPDVAKELRVRRNLHDIAKEMRSASGQIDDEHKPNNIPSVINKLISKGRLMNREVVETLLITEMEDFAVGPAWNLMQDAIYDYPSVISKANKWAKKNHPIHPKVLVEGEYTRLEIDSNYFIDSDSAKDDPSRKETIDRFLVNEISKNIKISTARAAELKLKTPEEIQKYEIAMAEKSLELARKFAYATNEVSIYNRESHSGDDELAECIGFAKSREIKEVEGGDYGPLIHYGMEELHSFGTSWLRRSLKIDGVDQRITVDDIQGALSNLNEASFKNYESYVKKLHNIRKGLMEINPDPKELLGSKGKWLKKFNADCASVDPNDEHNFRLFLISGIVNIAINDQPLRREILLRQKKDIIVWTGSQVMELIRSCEAIKDKTGYPMLDEEETKWLISAVSKGKIKRNDKKYRGKFESMMEDRDAALETGGYLLGRTGLNQKN